MEGPCEQVGESDLINTCLQFASDFLWLATGKRYPGICGPITVRPNARMAAANWAAVFGGPVPIGGGSFAGSFTGAWDDSWGSCGCNREARTGCGSLSELRLGYSPIASIDQVIVNGTVLDPSRYRVDDFAWLVRLPDPDGTNPGWPCCQRQDRALTEDQTWGVTLHYGKAPPSGGRECAALLGCELAKAFDPAVDPSKCALPNRVVSVARQGVTMQMLNPLQVLDEGLTGIYFVDAWIRMRNPNRLERRATASSPDIGRRVRRAGTWTPS